MRKYFAVLLVACVLGLNMTTVSAASQPAVTQSYSADSSVLAGMLVELKPKTSSTVTALPSQDLGKMLGVVVPINDAPLVLTSPTTSGQQVLVATSGRYNVLVSNQAGAIKSGDYLTISALSGIGMKAGPAQPEIVGQAETDFNGGSNVLGSVPIKSSAGGNLTAAIGSIPVNVHLAPNPVYKQSGSNKVPAFLSKTANSVANKNVGVLRIYLAGFTLLATMLITSSLLYGGASSGVTAIGRNPLAKKAIGRGLFKIAGTGLAVFAAGLAAAYLILKI